jgi:hypothetical protein
LSLLCGPIDSRGCAPPPLASGRCSKPRGRVFNQRLHVFREILCAITAYDLRHREAIAQAQTLRIARQRPRFEKDGSDVGARQNE